MNVSNFLFLGSLLSDGAYIRKYIEKVMQQSVVTIRGGPGKMQSLEGLQKPKVYLFFSETFDVETSLQCWTELPYFNTRAKFWIVTEDTPTEQFFKVLSKFHVFDAIVVTNSNQLYSYNPYKFENVEDPNTTPLTQNFTMEMPQLWRNTTLKVLTKCIAPYVDCSQGLGGNEIKILNLIQELMKFKIRHIVDHSFSFGLIKKNGTYSDSFGRLQNRQVDMLAGSFRTIGTTQYRDFDYSTNHLEDKLVWVVPEALPIVHWMRIIKSFDWKLWLLLAVVALVMGKFLGTFSRLSGEPTKLFKKFAFGTSFSLLVGRNLKKTPGTHPMRVIFIFWVYFGMTLNIVFNSNLMNVFFGNFVGYQINSFQEIVSSNMNIGLTDDVMHILKRDPDWPSLVAQKNIITCPLGTYCLNRTIYQRNLVGCWAERSIKHRIITSYQNGVHLVDDHLMYFYVVFYFVKGYPMVPQISKVISRLRAAGLIEHIMSKTGKVYVQHEASKVLTFKRLKGPFYFLAFAWGVGVVIFLGEIIWHRKMNKKWKT